jgi:tRNA threonylcarbamoyladenosine biosynthesis protein TsaE
MLRRQDGVPRGCQNRQVEFTLASGSPEETRQHGRDLGEILTPGDVLLLTGELGSGKTCFTQGVAVGLGVSGAVKSSSFILLAEYSGRMPLYHADLFRLTSHEEAAELHLEEYAANGALVVEWPERAWQEMPAEHVLISFSYHGETSRGLDFVARGERAEAIIAGLFGVVRSS